MRSRSKSEIAMAAGFSLKTLYRWMKTHHEELSSMGITPNQRVLPPKAVEYICYELGIHEEDFAA